MSTTDELLRNAELHAERHDDAGLAAVPRKRVAIVACMDARLNPYEIFGIGPGDAHVIRNAGGVITDDEVRSLAISQHLLGTEEVILVHHTDCGMLSMTDEEFADRLEREAGARPPWRAHAFSDLEDDLRRQAERLRRSPFIAHKGEVRGFVYEVETGRLREVELSASA